MTGGHVYAVFAGFGAIAFLNDRTHLVDAVHQPVDFGNVALLQPVPGKRALGGPAGFRPGRPVRLAALVFRGAEGGHTGQFLAQPLSVAAGLLVEKCGFHVGAAGRVSREAVHFIEVGGQGLGILGKIFRNIDSGIRYGAGARKETVRKAGPETADRRPCRIRITVSAACAGETGKPEPEDGSGCLERLCHM